MKRREKLCRNILLTALALIGIWLLLGKPLPLLPDYRRAERTYFLEPKAIVHVMRQDGRVLSRDRDSLYLFQQTGWTVENRSIQQFPLEDGFGCAMAAQRGLAAPMTFYAVDGSEAAETVELCYTITPEGDTEPAYMYLLHAAGVNGVFVLPLVLEPTEDGGYSGREQDYVTDVYELWQGYRTHSDVTCSVTFYDAQGNTIKILQL